MGKKKEDKVEIYVEMTKPRSKIKKSAYDVAREWQKLGKDKIRKMQSEGISVPC